MSSAELSVVEVGVGVIFFVAYLLAVVKPLKKIHERPVSQADIDQWETTIDRQILALSTANLDALTPTNRELLGWVLRDTRGRVRPGAIDSALGHLSERIEHRVRALRTLSAISVLLGLLWTVVLLAIVLWSSQDDVSKIGSNIWTVYVGNIICIASAVVLGVVAHHDKQHGSDLLIRVSRSFAKLTEDIESTDPQLVVALKTVAEQFETWADEAQQGNILRIEQILREVKTLAKGIQDLASSTVRATGEAQSDVVAHIVELADRAGATNHHLDEGFRLLAQPFLQGLPAFDKIRDETSKLSQAIQSLVKADLPGAVDRTTATVERLESSVGKLPELVRAALSGVGERIQEGARIGAREGVGDAVSGATERILAEIHARPDPAPAIDALSNAVGSLSAGVRTLPAEIAEALASALRGIHADGLTRADFEIGTGVLNKGLQDIAGLAARTNTELSRALVILETASRLLEKHGESSQPPLPKRSWFKRIFRR